MITTVVGSKLEEMELKSMESVALTEWPDTLGLIFLMGIMSRRNVQSIKCWSAESWLDLTKTVNNVENDWFTVVMEGFCSFISQTNLVL